jgi:hypothetical protein
MHLRTPLLKLNNSLVFFTNQKSYSTDDTEGERRLLFGLLLFPRKWQLGKVPAEMTQVAFPGALTTAEDFAKLLRVGKESDAPSA